MARVEITDTVTRPVGGVPVLLTGASVQVNVRGGGPATVYAAATGSTTRANPLTTRNGRVEPNEAAGGESWVESGSYDLVVSYQNSGWTQRFEATSGATERGSVSALGTGASDSTAIQDALDAANAAGGGIVRLIDGTYWLGATLTVYSDVSIMGAGRGQTVLKAINGTNLSALIKSQNFDTLTGGGTSGGVQHFCLADLTIDGNKANNPTGGAGIKHYGTLPVWENVNVRQCKGAGIISEWSSSAIVADGCEGYLSNVSSHDNDGSGFEWMGPHDAKMFGCHAFLNGAKGFHIKTNAAVCVMVGCHSWGISQTYAYYLESVTHLVNCEGEGASVAQVMMGHNDCMVEGGYYFGGDYSTAKKGFLLGDATHLAPTNLIVRCKTYRLESGALDFTNCGVNPTIELDNYQTTGPIYVGTVPWTSARVNISSTGVAMAAGEALNFPAGMTIRGASRALVVLGSNDKFQVNASNGVTFMPNGAKLRLYPDNYVTQNIDVDGTTGSVQPGTSTAIGGKINSGSGAPSKPGGSNPTAGDYYLRTDTPTTANQRIYVCTTGGATPVWSGIA